MIEGMGKRFIQMKVFKERYSSRYKGHNYELGVSERCKQKKGL